MKFSALQDTCDDTHKIRARIEHAISCLWIARGRAPKRLDEFAWMLGTVKEYGWTVQGRKNQSDGVVAGKAVF